MTQKIHSILNLTWKVGLGLLGLAAIVIGILIVDVWYEETRGRDRHHDRTLSSDVVVVAFHNNTVRVWNRRTRRYTTQTLRWVSGTPERDSLTVFCDRNGKRGFLNVKTGKIVIPAQYDKAWQFSEGLGAVLGKNGKIGFIDIGNNIVIDFKIPYDKGLDYIFKDGYCTSAYWDCDLASYVYGVIGKDGEQVLPWAYTTVTAANADGYRIVSNPQGAWLYDRHFNLALPESYDAIQFANGTGGVYLTKDHVKQLADYSGKVIEPFVIDTTYPLYFISAYHEDEADEYELVPDSVIYEVGRGEGLMDARTGRILTPAKYWQITMISKDLIRARLGYSGESVVLDKRGHLVIQ